MVKSAAEMYEDSIERSINNILYAYDYDEYHMIVINNETKGEYLVDIDHESGLVMDCDCPHRVYRAGILHVPCKHMVFVADKLGYRTE